MKNKVFIGSSKEGLKIAQMIKKHLPKSFSGEIWNSGKVFKMSEYNLESLESKAGEYECAIFIFTQDDFIKSRKKKGWAPRDNVLFETGLFLGKLGRKRTFIVCVDSVKMPSDLNGLVVAKIKSSKNITDEIKNVGNSIYDAIQMAPQKPYKDNEEKVLSERIKGEDELYSAIVGDSHKRSGVLICHTNTKWAWKLFPSILRWSCENVPVFICLSAAVGDKKNRRQEKYRRDLLKNMGVILIEKNDIPCNAFCMNFDSYYDFDVFIINEDTSGCQSFASRYHGEEHTVVAMEIINKLKKLFGKKQRKYIPKIKKYAWNEVTKILKEKVEQYKDSKVSIEYAVVPTSKLRMIAKYTKGYKYSQTSYIYKLCKAHKLLPFEPFCVKLKNKSYTIATPPIVEQKGKDFVVIEGNTRATFFHKSNIKKFPCLLVKGVSMPFPSVPIPISKVLVSLRTISPKDRMDNFKYEYFRHIERAVHPY